MPAGTVKERLVSPRFLKFLLAGGVAAGVNFGSRIVFNNWMPFTAAIVLAYIAGMITAFILTKLFVFTESVHSTSRSAMFFTLVNLVAVLQTWVVSVVLAFHLLPLLGVVWHKKEIAHLVGVIVPVFTSYVGHKKLSFRSH
ncbi:GtrA family protein [Paraburkholderia caffeinilytica]|uniref:GtrA family protein n=1 Tax=Paraburkholderia caffeinilytica TaxID=1761016 RepID=UPI003DA0F4FD